MRRIFGYIQIIQGIPTYEVGKLIGHSSVTTAKHNSAPLLAMKLNDFVFKNNGKCNANHLNKKTCMCVNHYKCNFIPMWLSIKPNAL